MTGLTIGHPGREPAPKGWRDGAAAVAVLSFDLDAESPILAHGDHYATHLSTMSHQAYGPLVGIPRLLDLLRRLDVRSTFFVPGLTADRWPQAVAAVLDEGHEVALHSYAHRPLVDMTAEEQREDFERGLAAVRRAGADPVGYRAPMWQQTRLTLDLVRETGLLYDSSLMDDDRPYRFHEGRLAELPVHWMLDDWEQYAFLPDPAIGTQIELPAKVLEMWTGELDAMRQTGSLCMITMHPFLSGRPSRLRIIEQFVTFARATGDVQLLCCKEVAERVLDGPPSPN